MKKVLFLLFITIVVFKTDCKADHSVARKWNEVLLTSIRGDYARPTVHARNLFHTSVLMYDSWAVFDPTAETYFLDKDVDGFTAPFEGIEIPEDKQEATETMMSYACYRLLTYRFSESPGSKEALAAMDSLLNALGHDKDFISEDYTTDNSYAALGNYLGNQMIEFGKTDGSNELDGFSNTFYEPLNTGLVPINDGNPTLAYPNNWQPLVLEVFIDQSGNQIYGQQPEFLSPEWGFVKPFSLEESDKEWKTRGEDIYPVYLDPGAPDAISNEGIEDDYKWGFLLTSMWSSHLHPSDSVKWDISPKSIGNLSTPLNAISDIRSYYKDTEGGDYSTGYTTNPITGEPYQEQIVPRGDYGRVLAEFWADGPDSETPPGHWFTILNYVSDHDLLEKKYKGQGDVLDDLQWDVKSYFILGGAMHDCAIAAWGIKGYHDYVRPISAIRYMADQGQSTDSSLASYSAHGIPLVEGYSELVKTGDPLAGVNDVNVGKIKLYSWKGPDYISDSEIDDAGVDWILGEDWWPYQRPTFITPPFAGFVSGHSTFSRAAADVLTALTGSPYFPGGMGEFVAKKNEFLVFEEGPSVDVVLQWASYRDASDQTSLSRIWGGIHPPMDDLPGRIIGEEIAVKVVGKVDQYFLGDVLSITESDNSGVIFPNPIVGGERVNINWDNGLDVNNIKLYSSQGYFVKDINFRQLADKIYIDVPKMASSYYFMTLQGQYFKKNVKVLIE